MDSQPPLPFCYPKASRHRRLGPSGYTDLRSYRPWLRDEFDFRCVYCLLREQWGRVVGEFDLDHFVAEKWGPTLASEYDNLLYCCHTCNLRKGANLPPDPMLELVQTHVRVYPDGRLKGLTDTASRLIRVLCLNSPKMIGWRRTWIRIVELAEKLDADLYRRLMGFPDDLPDLSKNRVPVNFRPEGVHDSYFARRVRGELPETYVE